MDLKLITADNMRKLAPNNDVSINDILTRIETEATNGKSSLYISDYDIGKENRDELESRGFHVETGGRYNEINTVISWNIKNEK